jgi:hypothetical protein
MDHYVTEVGYALIGEEEHSNTVDNVVENCNATVRALEIPGAANRQYIAVVAIESDIRLSLRYGDVLKFDFQMDYSDPEGQWHGVVMQHQAVLPKSTIGVLLTRKWKSEEQKWVTLTKEITPVVANSHDTIESVQARLYSAPSLPVIYPSSYFL